jgi:hypothetical protein
MPVYQKGAVVDKIAPPKLRQDEEIILTKTELYPSTKAISSVGNRTRRLRRMSHGQETCLPARISFTLYYGFGNDIGEYSFL